MFANSKAGRQIFSQWRARLGKVDQYEELRISIVEGDIPGMDAGYWLHISSKSRSNCGKASGANGVCNQNDAVHRPESGAQNERFAWFPHLARFKKEFSKRKRYLLIPVFSGVEPGIPARD